MPEYLAKRYGGKRICLLYTVIMLFSLVLLNVAVSNLFYKFIDLLIIFTLCNTIRILICQKTGKEPPTINIICPLRCEMAI